MRKTTLGRKVQHIQGHSGYWTRDKSGRKKKFHPPTKGKAIRHVPNRPDPNGQAPHDAKYILWQECEGAKRRGWK